MSDALLLDTHIVLWLDAGEERLRPQTRALIDACWSAGGTIYLSAVTAWEIAFLVDVGRVSLDVAPRRWVERFLERPGVVAAPLNLAAASRAYDLVGLDHRDPADRLLIATAIQLACPMVTYDERIAAFATDRGAEHGFTVVAG